MFFSEETNKILNSQTYHNRLNYSTHSIKDDALDQQKSDSLKKIIMSQFHCNFTNEIQNNQSFKSQNSVSSLNQSQSSLPQRSIGQYQVQMANNCSDNKLQISSNEDQFTTKTQGFHNEHNQKEYIHNSNNYHFEKIQGKKTQNFQLNQSQYSLSNSQLMQDQYYKLQKKQNEIQNDYIQYSQINKNQFFQQTNSVLSESQKLNSNSSHFLNNSKNDHSLKGSSSQYFQKNKIQTQSNAINDKDNSISNIINQLKQGTEDDKTISSILEALNKVHKQLTQQIENSIFIVGNTGAAKTTLTAFLAGYDLAIKKDQFGLNYLDYLNKNDEDNGKIGVKGFDSETHFPNKFTIGNITFWDCPGFADSRGQAQNIVNSFYMSMIAQNVKRVKFILAIDGQTLHNSGAGELRGEAYKVLFETLNSMSQDTAIDFSRNLIIVITKAEEQYLSIYKSKLPYLINELQNSKGFFEQIKSFYKSNEFDNVFNSLKNCKIVLFPKPPQNGYENQKYDHKYRYQILNALDETYFYEGKRINVPSSIQSLKYMKQLWQYSRQKISESFKVICKQLATNLINLEEQELIQVENLIKGFCKKYSKYIPEKSSDYIKKLLYDFIEPLQKIVYQYSTQKNQLFKQNFSKNWNIIKFFVREVYDGLLSQIKLSNESNEFFGKMSLCELSDGLISLREGYENAKTNIQQKNILREKVEKIKSNEIQISNLERSKITILIFKINLLFSKYIDENEIKSFYERQLYDEKILNYNIQNQFYYLYQRNFIITCFKIKNYFFQIIFQYQKLQFFFFLQMKNNSVMINTINNNLNKKMKV